MPMIAGQSTAFLIKRLDQYRAGLFAVSDESAMSDRAAALSDREMEDLAV